MHALEFILVWTALLAVLGIMGGSLSTHAEAGELAQTKISIQAQALRCSTLLDSHTASFLRTPMTGCTRFPFAQRESLAWSAYLGGDANHYE
ncbi:MAG: hypothetical protein Q8P05_05770 [Candidatus Diapherotrites archaeon]|nr:hypothetical protein [Candidatus Diapherotrites archaeon]MDZ4256611.1 hypothetical protein [archaeon]